MSQTPPSPETLTFYIPAKGFLQAAQMVVASPLQNESRRAMTFLPINTLLGFSVELYCKAWLAANGRAPDELRKQFGHKLRNLYVACVNSGLELGSLETLASQLEAGHGDFSYRYFEPSRVEYEGANTAFAFHVLNELDALVDARVGASASMGLVPGH
ncbi:hypothetical protein [Caulobacter sp. S45]|uniref:hypothetical protein n=1 Tax=Caulobacter sp. S45 TaxID=1641861 RepID=UPI00131DA1F3|nr:hypothetical protein [Caulobacter sp. S45]